MFDKLKAYMNDSEEDSARVVRDAMSEYESIIELLLSAGADPSLQVSSARQAYIICIGDTHLFLCLCVCFRTRRATLPRTLT